MLNEALNTIVDLARSSRNVQTITSPADPTKTLLFLPDGSMTEAVRGPCDREHHVTDLASLKTCVERYGSDVAIWVSFDEVVAILDDNGYRSNRVWLPLGASPLFSALLGFGKTGDPKSLYRFLKFDCQDSAISPPDLDLLISNLKFRTEDELTRDVGKSKDNMGQSIRSSVTGADKIPDWVSFSFLPWPGIEEEFQAEVTVPCQLYIDPAERTISLKPLAGAISAAQSLATSQLAESIREYWNLTNQPVLCGTP